MNLRAVVVVAAAVLACASGGCRGVARTVRPAPAIVVDEDVVVAEKGTACGVDVDAQAGRLPEGSLVLVRYHVMASAPVPLPQVLDLLATYARRRCAHGVRVLRAEGAEGATGFIAAEGAAYALPSS